ncbi:uncharacterized protein C22orf31-like [Epinephelus fuscoguttatus]|uniref:uncharacterized protein C22orf31-like n=1 Tax=Epinephelus fuscoguttatus TaxID=293821 RepID=UPI0020D0BC4E|nr:uncharacterized protein C22orf31-like [Epinephelus fuscoguttatus]
MWKLSLFFSQALLDLTDFQVNQKLFTTLARRTAARRQCPHCRDDQVPTSGPDHQHSAGPAGKHPQKRKRTSVARPPSEPLEAPEVVTSVATPEPSTSAANTASVLNLVPRPSATISSCSSVAPSSQPDDGPLLIHNRTVEAYQCIYHEVVDDMLRDLDGRLHPYSLALGRRIKQRLWERLERPTLTESVSEDGLVRVGALDGVEDHPPLYDVRRTKAPQTATEMS